MRRFAPLLTLLAVAVLGGALLTLNVVNDPANATGTPSAAAALAARRRRGPDPAAAPPADQRPAAPRRPPSRRRRTRAAPRATR